MPRRTKLLLALAVLILGTSACDQGNSEQKDQAGKARPQAEQSQDMQEAAEAEKTDQKQASKQEQEGAKQKSGAAKPGHAPYAVGTHYRVLDEPVDVADPDKVEVREFFFYGCPHCFDAEPIVSDWLEDKPADVDFVRTPVLFLKNAEPLARAFYVAQNQDMIEKVHRPLFKAIHEHREPLFSVPALANFFREYGLKPEKFNELYSSFGVSTKVRQAESIAREYEIRGVPAFTVDGQYVVLRRNLADDYETFEVIDYLIKKARKADQ